MTGGRWAVAIAVLAAIGPVAACGSEGSGDGAQPEPTQADFDELIAGAEDLEDQQAVAIDVADNQFVPEAVRLHPGATVTWSNAGRNEHNVTPVARGSFEGVATADFGPGESFEASFDEPGTYGYFCSIHGTPARGQRGVIVVR